MIDIHSHILPGLDDAPAEMETVVEMLALAELDGIEHIVATPHFAPGIHTPSADEARARVSEVRARAEEAGLAIRVSVAHEVRAGAGIFDRLRRGELLAYDENQRYLLLELPGNDVPEWAGQLIYELKTSDVVPVLAHPERNLAIIRNPVMLYDLVVRGCLVQVTAGSVLGVFGGGPRQVTELLLQHDLVHAVASDAHNDADRAPVLSHARTVIGRLIGEKAAAPLFDANPRRIVEGSDFYVPEPKRPGAGGDLLGRLRRMVE